MPDPKIARAPRTISANVGHVHVHHGIRVDPANANCRFLQSDSLSQCGSDLGPILLHHNARSRVIGIVISMFFDEDPHWRLAVLTAARIPKHACAFLDALSLQGVNRRYTNLE
jgi:hypothetical protein